ncbi:MULTISPECIES: hypothetical protein [Lactobacillus]|nr:MULTISPECIES: hypothetical protein [Lactobacillus]RVU73435.1 hypothetical protein EJK20_08075 [Lactobacillus xujianguonis]
MKVIDIKSKQSRDYQPGDVFRCIAARDRADFFMLIVHHEEALPPIGDVQSYKRWYGLVHLSYGSMFYDKRIKESSDDEFSTPSLDVLFNALNSRYDFVEKVDFYGSQEKPVED